ncbi:MAG: hypothetical protein U1E66_08070 [Rhodospirillales bacterium]
MQRAGRLAALIRWAGRGLLVGAVSSCGGCQALPLLPAAPPAEESVARDLVAGAAASFCVGALAWLEAEPARDVRLDLVGGPASTAADDGSSRRRAAGPGPVGTGTSDIELVLRDVRDLPLPRLPTGKVTPLAEDGSALVEDYRSRLADLPAIVDKTVFAADLAYDIRERSRSWPTDADPTEAAAVARELPGYVIRKIYVDDFSGLKAFALESGDATHRIYAIAGTQVFVNRDYRDWASGLMMARPQFVSDASLLLARDAADYASDPKNGGEVFFTGQSQGAIISQALGFLTQELLNERRAPHRLIHVVSWGVSGATEPIVEMIERSRRGQGRDIWPPIERHWSLTDADEHRVGMQVWNVLEARWARLRETEIADHVGSVARQMHVIGYFFDIDPFARLGTFLGTPLVFPVELVLPQRCEPLVIELVLDTRVGDIGLQLESHFLKGYRRAVQRGAVGLARPARIEQRKWVLDLLPTAEEVGGAWLSTIYLTRLGEDQANWQQCFASGHWMTNANRDCRRTYWPGCAPEAAEDRTDPADTTAEWCLVAGGETEADAPAGRSASHPEQ